MPVTGNSGCLALTVGVSTKVDLRGTTSHLRMRDKLDGPKRHRLSRSAEEYASQIENMCVSGARPPASTNSQWSEASRTMQCDWNSRFEMDI